MKTKHYFFLSCAVLGLAWGWVYNVSGQTSRPAEFADADRGKEVASPADVVKHTPTFKAPGDVEIYAAMSYNEEWEYDEPFPGIYSVALSEDSSHEPIELTEERTADGGAVYVDGVFYAISGIYEEYEEDSRLLDVVLTAYDSETWDVIFEKTGLSYNDMAADLAYDPSSGKVYGIFKNNYDREWGIFDVETGKHTVIKEKMTGSAAVAFDMSGQAYGITNEGQLVTIDKETGETSAPLASYDIYQAYQSTAVIDPVSGDFYWLADSYRGGGVYKIDMNSYELTQLYSFENMERFAGAYIPGASVEPGTPAAATNLSVAFPDGALTGTVSFDAPTVSWDDDDLSGSTFSYIVNANEEKVAEGSIKAGESATLSEISLSQGYNKLTVTLSNEEGEGLPASVTAWIGLDGPAAVSDVKAVADGQSVTISWIAPTEGMHKGYVNPADFTYTLKRFPDEVIVAENIAENTFTDAIESTKLAKYYYVITPFHKDIEGNPTSTEKVMVGEAAELPWDCSFSEEDCELITVENTNGDDVTWNVVNDWGAVYRYADMDGDDWLFTVPFKLETGRNYHLVTSMNTSRWTNGETFEIKYGNAANSEAMTETLVDVTDFGPEPESYPIDIYFSVKENGTYFIGFHALSDIDHSTISIDNILFELGPNDMAPSAPEISAKAGERGELSTTLTMIAPAVTFNGSTLTQLNKADIYLANEYVGSVDNVEPGKTYTYTDKNCVAGINTYKVIFVNDEGNGTPAETSLFVGSDLPLAPTNVKVTVIDDIPVLSWDAPGEIGVNGGYVDSDNLGYTVQYVDEGEWLPLDEEIEDTRVEIGYNLEGEQRWFVCAVIAYNELGTSDVAYSNGIIAGDSYAMPFSESFDGGGRSYFWASSNPFGSQIGSWSSDSNLSASENGGCILFWPYTFIAEPPFCDTLTSGIVDVEGISTATLSFWYYNDAELNAGDELSVELYDQANDKTYHLGSVAFDNSATEWREFKADCAFDAMTTGARIHVAATSINGNKIYLDEFRLDASSSVGAVSAGNVSVTAGNGCINICDLSGELVLVASVNGSVEYNTSAEGNVKVSVSPGIYVVRVADRSFKVIVK